MEVKELVKALKNLQVQIGSLACLGGGHEHGCGMHGCAILRDSANLLESMREELDRVKAERDAAINDLKAGAWCENCAHYADMAECGEIPMCNVCHVECYCKDCNDGNKWAWRGLKEE